MHEMGDRPFQWSWREGNKAYGWGIACAYKNTGLGGGAPDKSAAEVEAFEDGTIEVRTSAADMGQGLGMVVAQCAAEELGVPYDRVKVLLSDTDLTPDAGATTASRQTYVTGNAARLAASALREALRSTAAEVYNVDREIRFEEGLVRFNGTTLGRSSADEGAGLRQGAARVLGSKTQPLGTGGDMHFAFSMRRRPHWWSTWRPARFTC